MIAGDVRNHELRAGEVIRDEQVRGVGIAADGEESGAGQLAAVGEGRSGDALSYCLSVTEYEPTLTVLPDSRLITDKALVSGSGLST